MVSIIVPFYNSRRYLNRAINSILSQTYKEIELILVNDGSSDESVQVCEDYLERDERVVLINKANEGVDKSRFDGLKIANGEYVAFIDADDWLEPDALSSMMAIMNDDYYDYIQVSSYKCLGPIRRIRPLPFSGCISLPVLFEKYYISFFGWNLLPVSIWGKLYRREVIKKAGLAPSGFAMGEDLIFNMHLFPFLNKIYLLNEPYYNYRYGGMTTRYNPHLLKDLKAQFLLKLQAIDKYSYHKADDPVRIEMVNVFHSDIKQRIIFQKQQTRESSIQAIREEISDNIWGDVLNIASDYLDRSLFYDAFKNRDAERMYDICKKEVDSSKFQRLGKRALSGLLNLL